MRIAGETLGIVVGVAVVIATIGSAIKSTILPRGVPVRLSRFVVRAVRAVFGLWAGGSASYERRDSVMAAFAPVALLSQLLAWLVIIYAAFVVMYLAVATSSVRLALELSGSSLFTLGTANPGRVGPDLLTYAEAGLGLLLVTLLITYMPSIYAAFSRREIGVGRLRTRAGTPPSPVVMLRRLRAIEETDTRLTELWSQWEEWFVDIEETHTSFAILSFFRSPRASESWVNSAGVVLDAASLWLAAVSHGPDPEAHLCIRSGFLALRSIATLFNIHFDPDPAPTDPVTISRSEFDEVLDQMRDGGLPVIDDRDAAWAAYRGWRVNYDTVLLDLARVVEAPPTPWVSDRSPVSPRFRPPRRFSLRRTIPS